MLHQSNLSSKGVISLRSPRFFGIIALIAVIVFSVFSCKSYERTSFNFKEYIAQQYNDENLDPLPWHLINVYWHFKSRLDFQRLDIDVTVKKIPSATVTFGFPRVNDIELPFIAYALHPHITPNVTTVFSHGREITVIVDPNNPKHEPLSKKQINLLFLE